MSFLNPSASEARRRRWIVGGGAVLMTVLVMTAFLVESRWGYLPPDDRVVYFQSWAAGRSRADALADTRRTLAAREAKLAESRAYIATLDGKARTDAQNQYDAYVAGGGAKKDIPYVAPQSTVADFGAAEPPVQ